MLIIPDKVSSAAANMALDTLLLEAFPEESEARFRHYGWSAPSFTFGYSQPWAEVNALLPQSVTEVVRRPSGGGVVDHRNDWTYALVLPVAASRSLNSSELYCRVHKALGSALEKQGQPWQQFSPCGKDTQGEGQAGPSVCFISPAAGDVLNERGRKVAGAALKRNKYGLLLQGSIEKAAAPRVADWERFGGDFVDALCDELHLGRPVSHEWSPDERLFQDTVTRYASAEWNQKR